MTCNCKEWAENMPKVEAPRVFAAARNPGTGDYDGVPFRYCPWCGKLLLAEAWVLGNPQAGLPNYGIR